MRRTASRVLTCSLLLVGFGCVSPASPGGTGGSGSGTGGIGLEMDDDGTTKHAYSGSVSCFKVVLTGSSGGNLVRIGFTQSATPTSGAVAPYSEIGAFTDGYSGTICFNDVTCPGYAVTA